MARKKNYRAYLPMLIAATVLIVVLALMVYFISNLKSDKKEKRERKPQTVTLVKPPPPPPQPPKVEKPPEPPKEKIEEPRSEPEPEPEPLPDVDQPPPGDLGLDAEGGAGADGFGLVGRKGGRGLLGGGGGGSPFARYGRMAANEIQDVLSGNDELRRKGYTAAGKLWVNPDGSVQRIELTRGSNDAEIDDLLNRVLRKVKKLGEAPPPELEQPIKFKITVRM